MSGRWKYQLKWGTLWGTLMALAIMTFTAWELGNWTLFLSWSFFLRLIAFNLVGVFLVGWLNWRELQKRHKS